MKRRAKTAKAAVSVELFPFLAVLMCTMGSLIVLLMIAVCHARDEGTEAAEEAAAAASAPTAEEIELNERIGYLKSQYTSALAKRDEAEKRRRTARDELDRARRELSRLSAAADNSARDPDVGNASDRLAALRGRIAELELELDSARAAAAAPPSYAILPFDGPNGTRRRPIYIECLADKIVLQPEGIVLTERDFLHADTINPLTAALKAAADYYATNNAGAVDPYPLLVVRPDGIGAFYVARAALKYWTGDFGYELVDDDWKLDYQEPDPQLKRRLESMVELVRSQLRRAPTVVAGGGGGGGGSGRRFRVSNRGGLTPAYGDSGAGSGSAAGEETGGDFNTFAFGGGSGGGGSPRSNASARAGTESGAPGGSSEEQGHAQNAEELTSEESAEKLDSTARAGQKSRQGSAHGATPDSSATGDAAAETAAGGRERSILSRTRQPPSERGAPGGSAFASDGDPGDPAAAKKAPAELRAGEYRERVKRLADTRGEDWALKNATGSSHPITRPLRVQCSAGELILLPDRPGDQATVVRFGDRTSDCADAFRTALWERMDRWGIAGRGMHWKPILEADVVAGGEQRFAELEQMLDGSGLTVRQRRGPAPRTARPRR